MIDSGEYDEASKFVKAKRDEEYYNKVFMKMIPDVLDDYQSAINNCINDDKWLELTNYLLGIKLNE